MIYIYLHMNQMNDYHDIFVRVEKHEVFFFFILVEFE